jgi:hypothetical protein
VSKHGHCGLDSAASSLLEGSSGFLSELKDTDLDSNPFDIVSKLSKTKKTKYVSGKQIARRITALDEEEIKKRLELKDTNFGDESGQITQKQLKVKARSIPNLLFVLYTNPPIDYQTFGRVY